MRHHESGRAGLTLRGAPITVGFLIAILAIEITLSAAGLFSDRLLRQEVFIDFAPIFWGAALAPEAETYTLATSALLHGYLLHALINAAVIAFLGPPIERAVGRLYYASALILLAIATPLGHMGWLLLSGVEEGYSSVVGASGVLFGLLAIDICARAAAIGRTRPEMRAGLPKPAAMILQSSAMIILLNVAIEAFGAQIAGSTISGAGHIGGYLAGLALAPVLIWASQRPRDARGRFL